MRERVNPRRFNGERGVELVTVGEAKGLRERRDRVGIPGEVQRGRAECHGAAGSPRGGRYPFLQFAQPLERPAVRSRLSGFPAVDGEKGYTQLFGEFTLGEPEGFPQTAHSEPHIRPG